MSKKQMIEKWAELIWNGDLNIGQVPKQYQEAVFRYMAGY